MKLAIILTGTVEPAVKGGHFTAGDRFKMYSDTLDFYAKEIGRKYPIVFVENSNADLSKWDERFKNSLDLTVMQFRPDGEDFDGFDNSMGKGYNEYLMIKKGVLRFKDNPSLKDVTHFLKITGRYPMINVNKIIREIERRGTRHSLVFMGDVKDTCIYELIGKKTLSSHWGDSRFFMVELNFYQQKMIDCYREMNDYTENKWAEHYFLHLSREYRREKLLSFRFYTQVRFGGISGDSTLGEYNSPKNKIKASVRQILRYLFPYIWF